MMFCSLVCLLVGTALCVTVKAQSFNPCAGKADGTITQFTCDGYTECFQEAAQVVSCGQGYAFERSSSECIAIGTGDTDCGLPNNDCSGQPTQMYTDETFGCQTFYHCVNGIAFPRQYCGPDTVFDQDKQHCSHIADVPPPCGGTSTSTQTPSTETNGSDDGDAQCPGMPDGFTYPLTCDAYIECLGGIKQTRNCLPGYVFDRNSQSCKRIGLGDTDCGFPVYDCYGETNSIKTDDRYGCQTFYYCENDAFLSPRQYCENGLVFNVGTQRCDNPSNVPPPCGTKI